MVQVVRRESGGIDGHLLGSVSGGLFSSVLVPAAWDLFPVQVCWRQFGGRHWGSFCIAPPPLPLLRALPTVLFLLGGALRGGRVSRPRFRSCVWLSVATCRLHGGLLPRCPMCGCRWQRVTRLAVVAFTCGLAYTDVCYLVCVCVMFGAGPRLLCLWCGDT